jgi:hypothetical protein
LNPYAQAIITRLHGRAESYRQSGPSAEHTADLLDEAAGCIATLLGDLHAYEVTFKRIAEDEASPPPGRTATGEALTRLRFLANSYDFGDDTIVIERAIEALAALTPSAGPAREAYHADLRARMEANGDLGGTRHASPPPEPAGGE